MLHDVARTRGSGAGLIATFLFLLVAPTEQQLPLQPQSCLGCANPKQGKSLLQAGFSQDKVLPVEEEGNVPAGAVTHGAWALLRSSSTGSLLEVLAEDVAQTQQTQARSGTLSRDMRLGIFKTKGGGALRSGDEIMLVDRLAKVVAAGKSSGLFAQASGGCATTPERSILVIKKEFVGDDSTISYGDKVAFARQVHSVDGVAGAEDSMEIIGEDFVIEECPPQPFSPRMPRCKAAWSRTASETL